jgi:rSAM/selenodomain-associated transferase 2
LLSIVIPTLNAAAGLPATLESLAPAFLDGLAVQLVIADGGSHDSTLAMAEEAGADIVQTKAGRGGQLAAGAGRARGDWLLFLHADTRLAPGWAIEVKDFIRDRGPECAGYFHFALDDTRLRARLLETAVAWRSRLFVLPYGDQGLVMSRRLYDSIGGFRPLPLMEDVDIARRLGRRFLRPLATRAVTSAARYRRDGYVRRSLRNLACLAGFFLGVAPARLARLYR